MTGRHEANTVWLGPALAIGTLVSEDAATVSAGLLVAADALPAAEAIAWISLGIWIGDLGLFAVGRCARRYPPLARWVDARWSADRLMALSSRLTGGAAAAILLSRVLPGTRVALYVAAGLFSVRAITFAVSSAVAAAAWSAAIVGGIARVGG